jgi:hypothetical protein
MLNLRNQLNNLETDDITSNSSTHKLVEWSYENEEMIAEWGDIAQCYKWLNTETHKYYKNIISYLTIPCIICSTISASATFGIPNVPESYQYILPFFIGSMTIGLGIVTTVQQFYRFSELKETHRILGIGWDKMARNIRIELSKSPIERSDARHFIKFTRIEFDRLMENSEIIPDCIIENFNNKIEKDDLKSSTHKPSKMALRKPDICDRIVSINKSRRLWFPPDLESGDNEDTKDSLQYTMSPKRKHRSSSRLYLNERMKNNKYTIDLNSLQYIKPPIEPTFNIDNVFTPTSTGKHISSMNGYESDRRELVNNHYQSPGNHPHEQASNHPHEEKPVNHPHEQASNHPHEQKPVNHPHEQKPLHPRLQIDTQINQIPSSHLSPTPPRPPRTPTQLFQNNKHLDVSSVVIDMKENSSLSTIEENELPI